MEQNELASPEYRALLSQMHQEHPWGTKGFKYLQDVMPFYTLLEAKSILDYGCGQQSLKEAIHDCDPNIDVRGYDIGIPELSASPEAADLVVTTDVFEHIEFVHLKRVLDHTFSLANIGVFHCIALTPAKRTLPDGRNAHLIVKPAEWWLKRFERLPLDWKLVRIVSGRKTLKVWFRK
jgi:hypothetical protein